MLCSDCGGYDRCGHCLTEVGPIGPWRERVSRLAKLLGEARYHINCRASQNNQILADDIDAALSVSGLAEKEVGE